MKIVGCDFHPSWQQVALFDPQTGEIAERKLVNGDGEAERFYRELEAPARVGLKRAATASGLSSCWSGWGTRFGSGMRPRYAPVMCAVRRRIGATQDTFCGC